MAKCVCCGKSGLTLKVDAMGYCPDCQAQSKKDIEAKISEMQAELDTLRAFHAEYLCIPSAKEEEIRILSAAQDEASKIISDANTEAERIVSEANETASHIRDEASAEAERVAQELNSLKADTDLQISVKLSKANEKLVRIKQDTSAVVATAEAQLSALYAAASKNFAFMSKTTMATTYAAESKASSFSSKDSFSPIASAAFKKAAKSGYVVFDLETTGLSRINDRIIEIGAIKFDGEHNELGRYSTFVNPEMPIPKSATEINNITDAMVADAPFVYQVMPDFLEFVGVYPLIAHNASFDISFLNAVVEKYSFKAHIQYADSLAMARKAYDLPSHRLGSIAEHLGIIESDSHRAIGDCETLAQIVKDLLLQ